VRAPLWRSYRHLVSAGLGACLATFVIAAHALAGTYDVNACNPAYAGAASPSWVGVVDSGFTAYSLCPAGEGIVARTVWDNGTSSGFQGGYQIFDAPPGTIVDSFHGYVQLRRPDCNWNVGLVASDGDLGGTPLFYASAGQ